MIILKHYFLHSNLLFDFSIGFLWCEEIGCAQAARGGCSRFKASSNNQCRNQCSPRKTEALFLVSLASEAKLSHLAFTLLASSFFCFCGGERHKKIKKQAKVFVQAREVGRRPLILLGCALLSTTIA